MISIYKKSLITKFIFNFLKISLVFLVLTIILNLFEEINFFKDSNTYIILPVMLTLLNAPSVIFDILPFIFLISGMFFFIEILDKNELIIYKTYGLTNLKIIKIISTTTFLMGIFIILIFYNISSNLKFLYLDIKNDYSKDDKYLAVITANGLWIKDELNENINFINARKLSEEYLLDVVITQYDNNFNQKRVIVSERAHIKTKNWVLENVNINFNNSSQRQNKMEFKSNFDHKMITTIFENLSSLNLWQLQKLKKDYSRLGYDTNIIKAYQHKILSYPIYLTLMACISSILMLNIRYNKSKVFNLTIGILLSVIIYYINYFFGVIIETKKIPYIYSVWGPLSILFLIILTNLIRINEK